MEFSVCIVIGEHGVLFRWCVANVNSWVGCNLDWKARGANRGGKASKNLTYKI
jgi:hypothetical protein